MTTDASGTLRRTALHGAHLALGARMVPFGGFEMPVQYASILKEHDAVRKRAGLFDLSHMGQFTLTGENVGAWAESLTVNKVANMKPGQARPAQIVCGRRDARQRRWRRRRHRAHRLYRRGWLRALHALRRRDRHMGPAAGREPRARTVR